MKKNLILVATLAMAMGTATTMFTSCSSDDDLETAQAAGLETNQITNDNAASTFTYAQNGDLLTVKVSGDDVTISRSSSADGEPNGKLVYEDQFSGYIQMNDNTFGVDKLPFDKTPTTMHISFRNTNNFKGSDIFLYKKKDFLMSRASDAESKQLDEKIGGITNSLITCTIRAVSMYALGPAWTSLGEPLIQFMFPGVQSTADPNKARYEAIHDSINDMRYRLETLDEALQADQNRGLYYQHWDEMSTLRTFVTNYTSQITAAEKAGNTDQVHSILYKMGQDVVNGSSVLVYVGTLLDKFSNDYPGRPGYTWYDVIDQYLISSKPFFHQSLGERYYYRTEDFQTFYEILDLLYKYSTMHDIKYPSSPTYFNNELATRWKTYCNKWIEGVDFPIHAGETICTIPGARVAMDSIIADKNFGQGITFSTDDDVCTILHQKDDNDYYKYDGKWPYSYVFSDSKTSIQDKAQELKDLCLTKSEAEKMINYHNNKNLEKILLEDGKMTKARNGSSFMLLGDKASVYLSNCKDYICASRIDYKSNKYAEDKVQHIRLPQGEEGWFDRTICYYFYRCYEEVHGDRTTVKTHFNSGDESTNYHSFVNYALYTYSDKDKANGHGKSNPSVEDLVKEYGPKK